MKIVNFRDYISKGGRNALDLDFGNKWVYVGRVNRYFAGSPLANPFHVKEVGVELAIAYYRKWLWDKITERDPKVMEALARLDDDSVLVCWCTTDDGTQPLGEYVCHGQVIRDAWRFLVRTQIATQGEA